MTSIPVKRDFPWPSSFFSNNKPEFEVELDVHQYQPHEVDVKVSGDEVVVNCLHEAKVGQHTEKRELHRQYRLPPGVDSSTVKANLSGGGKLTLTAAGTKAPPPSSGGFSTTSSAFSSGGPSIIPVKHVSSPFSEQSKSKFQKQKFEVDLDVRQFAPNEIEVKVSGSDVIVDCQHNKDGIKRELHRQYRLPEGINPATVRSHLSAGGTLTVEAE